MLHLAPTHSQLSGTTKVGKEIHTGTVTLPGASHGSVGSALSVFADKLVRAVILRGAGSAYNIQVSTSSGNTQEEMKDIPSQWPSQEQGTAPSAVHFPFLQTSSSEQSFSVAQEAPIHL